MIPTTSYCDYSNRPRLSFCGGFLDRVPPTISLLLQTLPITCLLHEGTCPSVLHVFTSFTLKSRGKRVQKDYCYYCYYCYCTHWWLFRSVPVTSTLDLIQVIFITTISVLPLTAWRKLVMSGNRLCVLFISTGRFFFPTWFNCIWIFFLLSSVILWCNNKINLF